MKDEEKSEFGKGLVVCLVKFAEHAEGLRSNLDANEKMKNISTNPRYWSDSRAIEMWLNGASDHLYEIEVPKGEDWDKIRDMVYELKHKGLEIGHGFRTDKKWKLEDAHYIINLTEKIALEIDNKLGLNPQIGIN